MRIVRRSRVEETVRYSLTFRNNEGFGGLGFDCDAEGNVDEASLAPAGLANYRAALDGSADVTREGISTFTNRYRHPAEGRCDCRRIVVLGGFTNTCDCGLEYNSAGQKLAARACWGEETGEHPADIARIR